MQENNIKITEKLIEDISNYSWFKAVFRWGYIRKQIRDIKNKYNQFVQDFLLNKKELEFKEQTLQDTLHNFELQKTNFENTKNILNDIKNEKKILESKFKDVSSKNIELEKKLSSKQKEVEKLKEEFSNIKNEKKILESKIDDVSSKNIELEKNLTSKQKEIDQLKEEYEKKFNKLEETMKRYENKILNLEEKEKQKIEEKYKQMEKTWSKHEESVSLKINEICERLGISYINTNEYEYKGRPDNVIMIANEYVIFDAKSPKKYDELGNFSNYLKDQAEKAKKYAKHKKVKKDIYFVVPENTISSLTINYYEEGNYRVHIISINSLETILRSLQKIDDYENLKDMDPEERENIFNFIGKMLHAVKRRIQVDALYGIHVDSIIKEAISTCSEETKSQIEYYEKTSRWNPGRDEKKKRISNSSFNKYVIDLQKTAFSHEINIEKSEYQKIEDIPLLDNLKNKE